MKPKELTPEEKAKLTREKRRMTKNKNRNKEKRKRLAEKAKRRKGYIDIGVDPGF